MATEGSYVVILMPEMDPFTVLMTPSNLRETDPFFKLIIKPFLLKLNTFFNGLLMLNKFTHNSGTYLTSLSVTSTLEPLN
jgi:hypothetical protein